MKKINKGIVFSNDIFKILKGRNALDFNYEKKGLKIPNERQIKKLRDDFKKDVNRIFNSEVTIFSEEEMEEFMYESLEDSWRYPHCFIG